MKDRFHEGQEVGVLTFPDESTVAAGQRGNERITVIMENGQMAGVPWFAVWRDGKIAYKHNGAHVASVSIDVIL